MKNLFTFNVIICCFLTWTSTLSSQIVISTPNLGFSQACASESFNTFFTTFTFSPETGLDSSNQFIIELSDNTGNFSDSTIVYASAEGEITISPATLGFSIPDSTAGENYKIRVKSTAPAATSISSISFAAYYKIQDEPFSINNLVSTAVFCSGSSYILSIDNPGNESNDSPLQYPSLTFNWYKETSPTTAVFIALSETLTVTEPGTYFVETNYGTCTSNSFSNRVVVSEASSGEVITSINSSLGNPYCSVEGPTTLSTIDGNSYQWFKDDQLIEGETNQTLITNAAGYYEVIIDLGDCTAVASIYLENKDFTSTINVTGINNLQDGDILEVIVTTTANSPEYVWYLNNEVISGVFNNTFDASEVGNYRVVITQTIGCNASEEFEFTIIEPFPDVVNIPNLITPNGDFINDTWVIPKEYVSGSNTKILIMNTYGKVVFQSNDYQNNWPEDETNFENGSSVYYYVITTNTNKTRKGSITVIK